MEMYVPRKGKAVKQFVPRGDNNSNVTSTNEETFGLETSNQYDALKDSGDVVESTSTSMKQMNFKNQKVSLIPFMSWIGKVKAVKVIDYRANGLVIEFTNIDLDAREGSESPAVARASNSPSTNQAQPLKALISWKLFPSSIQRAKAQDRIDLIRKRLPVGTLFNVYIDSLNVMTNEFNLKFANRPALILNNDLSIKRPVKQKFRYIIVIDLEATCDYSPKPCVDNTNSEVIEFPWVVLDMQTLETVYEKQIYVKPDYIEGLTPYCKVLTGITEEMIQKGCKLEEAISQFNEYLKTLPVGSYQLLTDGAWDLSVQLKSEARRKKIDIPKYFYEYFDLKREFKKYLPFFPYQARDPPLHSMLQAFKLDFVGKHHSGLDDCLSIIQVVKTLANLGHNFEEAFQVDKDYDPSTDSTYFEFTPNAPTDSWKCETCTEKFSNESEKKKEWRAVWNKPFSSTCRFCSGKRPVDPAGLLCKNCGLRFYLSPQETEYLQSRNFYFPKVCPSCRYMRNHRQ